MQELIPPERLEAVAGLPGVVELLEFILVRDPSLRPSLADVADRCAPHPCQEGLCLSGTFLPHHHTVVLAVHSAARARFGW
jgi:hypothetical protein